MYASYFSYKKKKEEIEKGHNFEHMMLEKFLEQNPNSTYSINKRHLTVQAFVDGWERT